METSRDLSQTHLRKMSNTRITMFDVHGPFEIPLDKKTRGMTDTTRELFWAGRKDIAGRKGCYVFAIRTKGLTPYYVGMTLRTFKDEALNDRNIVRFIAPIIAERKGTPVLFILTSPKKQGRINETHIRKLEKFLIRQSLLVNPELKNIKGRKKVEWGIRGVFRGGQGSRSAPAESLRKCIGLHTNADIYFYSNR